MTADHAPETRAEQDSLGTVAVPAQALWGAQTERARHHFALGNERLPPPLITAYAALKKAVAAVNHQRGHLDDAQARLIARVCDELLEDQHQDQFPLHVWISGSGTQFNMNVNEVIANRCSQIAGQPLGSKTPVHPNDHVNMGQSTNDTFPTAMHIATAREVSERLLPSLDALHQALEAKATAWADLIKIGRTHLQDATPLTLGQEFSGYATMVAEARARVAEALTGVLRLTLGGTAVGTGINTEPGFAEEAVAGIARLTGLAFTPAPNRFALQGAHDDLVHLSSTLKTLATALFKIANDIRLLACGPRCGLAELHLPENEPGSSIMPGKVNPTQCESLTQICLQVIANDTAVTLGGGGGYLEMNVYKPLILRNLMNAIDLLADGCHAFRVFLVEDMSPDHDRLDFYVSRSLMLVTALSPQIGYDNAAKVAHHALAHDMTLKEAADALGFVAAADYDRLVDPRRMVAPHAPEEHQ